MKLLCSLLSFLFFVTFTSNAQVAVTVNGTSVTNGGTYNLGTQNGSTVQLTVVITNNSATSVIFVDDDGDTQLFDIDGNAASECSVNEGTIDDDIASGQSKDVVITYTPTISGSRTIAASFYVSEFSTYSFAFNITANMVISSIHESEDNLISLSPNPSNDGHFIVNTNEPVKSITVTNTLGVQEVFYSEEFTTQLKGWLMVYVKTANEEVLIRKVVVK